MAVHLRLRMAWQFHDSDPKNVAVMTPCFRVNGLFTDANSLCQDLAVAAKTFTGKTTPLTVTSYDLEGTPPVYPNGQFHQDPTATPYEPTVAPELCGVLSFFADNNRPRRRGRLYVPWFLHTTGGGAPLTLDSPTRTTIAGWVSRFASLGGANVDWIVWSGTDRAAHQVTNYFVKDSWGTQRRRGIKETARTTGTTPG